jgi:MFS family permease
MVVGEVQMHATTDRWLSDRPGGTSRLIALWRRQLDYYPESGQRVLYLSITVLCTVMAYYELFVGGSVSTLLLPDLGMSFTFYVTTLAIGNLFGAFGSLFAGVTDRLGRANLLVYGLLFTGVVTAFVLPAATNKWTFTVESFTVGVVEGIVLVATPALVRDFSPQVGRATAMGFWTAGPVIGSLVVTAVGTATIPAVVAVGDYRHVWSQEYFICGIAGIIVALIALFGLKELSPQLRDQLMVTMHDRALVEARARGIGFIDIEEALRRPFRQLVKPDVVISALAVAIMLLIYYTAVGFAVIYLTTVFGFSVKDANGLGNWNWGANVIAVIAIGFISDSFRVRKPFMVVGAVAAGVTTVIYLLQAGHHPSYYTLAAILAALSFFIGIAYTPWMASFTETVEARNPALIATGLAIWGWIVRVVVCLAFLLIPHVVTAATPLVDFGVQVQSYAAQYKSQIAFAVSHPRVVAIAQRDEALAKLAQGPLAPEIAVIQAHPKVFARLAALSAQGDPIPSALLTRAINDAGGGNKGLIMLNNMRLNASNLARIQAAVPGFDVMKRYQRQLTALSRVPPGVFSYLTAHAKSVQAAAAVQDGEWKRWYWVCVGGMVFFLLAIPLLRGRWSPTAAREDEREHEAMVDAELAAMRL